MTPPIIISPSLKHCYEYLVILLSSGNKSKFDLKNFVSLVTSLKLTDDDENSVEECCFHLLQLLDTNSKQFQQSCDIAYAFCLLCVAKLKEMQSLFSLLPTSPSVYFNKLFQHHEVTVQLLKNSPILVAGVLRYLIQIDHTFEINEYENLIVRLKAYIYFLLTHVDAVNALLFISDYFLMLIDSPRTLSCQLEIVTNTVMSIVTNYWNYHISEVRHRIKNLSLKCLKLSYHDSLKTYNTRSSFTVAVHLKLFKAFARDLLWSVPYKYFAYSVGLEFLAELYSVPKFLLYIQADLREGFRRSLQNKRVIRTETDLFKYCTEILSFGEWIEIFDPLVDVVMESNNMIIANNFSRYWLPVILRKHSTLAVKIWIWIPSNSSQRTASHSKILFTLLRLCHKQKIRLPVTENEKDYLTFMEACLADSEDTRGELFSLLCNFNDQSVLMSEDELNLILKFLRLNGHSSSTILRQQIFSSFANMVLRLILSSVNALKTKPFSAEDALRPTLKFLRHFNGFIIDGIRPGCSYQRKITSLTLYKIFMSYAVSTSGGDIYRNNLKNTETFVSFSKDRGYWLFTDKRQFEGLFRCLMDSCSEIQNLSFVLLRTYFDLEHVQDVPTLFTDAMALLKHNQFYRRQSAVVCVLSLICLAYNSKNNSEKQLLARNVECTSFIDMFLGILEVQTNVLMEDIINAALFEPLDATVQILTYLITDETSPEYCELTGEKIEKLVKLLEDIVPYLLKALFVDEFTDYAPSFEESYQALHRVIEKSNVGSRLAIRESGANEFQLKPLYQILLNFIWISLKACCECESKLVVTRTDLLNQSFVVRFSNLIVKKLKLCRHKGVIEAAAFALSNVVEKLTSQNICEHWLDSVLSDVIYLIEFKSSMTISRKSGGLSLLVQNIVGNDKRENKPLLTKCWLEFKRILNVNFETLRSSSSQELPQTHALHLLRVLIADTRNTYALSTYLEEIFILCIRSLKTPAWIVRNASMQLFGAILSKIVGQKNSQNDVGVRRSFEEVFVAMPSLLDHMLLNFEKSKEQGSFRLVRHCNVVPLLVLLSNLHVGSVNIMETSFRTKLFRLREHIESLLSSELYFVRKLTGKAMVSLHSKEEISVFGKINCNIIEQLSNNVRSENLLHGQLLTLEQAFSTHSQVTNLKKNLKTINSLQCEIYRSDVSLMSDALLYDLGIISVKNTTPEAILNLVENVFAMLPSQRYLSLGYDEWSLAFIRQTFKIDSPFLITLFKSLLFNNNQLVTESAFRALHPWIITGQNRDIFTALCDLMDILLHAPDSNEKVSILNLVFVNLIQIPNHTKFIDSSFVERNYNILSDLNRYQYHALNIRVLCLLITITRYHQFDSVLTIISSTLDISRFNRDLRLNAAEAVLLLTDWKLFQTADKVMIWSILVNLVLDEEDDIRLIACRCFQNISKSSTAYRSPNEVLDNLFNPSFMLSISSPENCLRILEEMLYNHAGSDGSLPPELFYKEITNINNKISNPFDQGVSNTYKEEIRLTELVGNAIKTLILKYGGKPFARKMKQEEIERIIGSCERIRRNKYLIIDWTYEIGLKCYYVLTIQKLLNDEPGCVYDCSFEDYIFH